MKRALFLFLALSLLVGCKTPFERALVKEVKKDIKENLKKPESLQDLVITYAIPTQDEIDKAREGREYETGQYKVDEGDCIVVVQYKARNSYNDLVDGFRVYRVSLYDGKPNFITELEHYKEHLFYAMLESKNKKTIK